MICPSENHGGESLHGAAAAYLAAGLCALPAIRAEKRPAVGKWKRYRNRPPTEDELSAWFANKPDAVCILCGGVSGHAEMIDFDVGGELFDAWASRIPPDLLARLAVEISQRGGRHVFYRCEAPVCGNMKLAQRLGPDGKVMTLIETRGEGGLFLCAPTPGYGLIQGDLRTPPVLTDADRDALLTAAWELNEYLPPPVGETRHRAGGDANESPVAASDGQPAAPGATQAERPGDEFNRRGDVRAVLQKAGWTLAKTGDNEYWRRPGKTSGWSASLKDRVFYVFSANAAPFESNRAYSPFSVYTVLNHGGDFERAASALRLAGYGDALPVDSGANISAIVEESRPPDTPRAPEIPDPGPVPPALLRVPGLVSEVMDHCLDTAPYPNVVMAFCGALALQAFLAGRKVRDPGDNRTNVYLLALAHSSAGKDHPRKVNAAVVHLAGLHAGLGMGFASGEGIQDALFQTPCMLYQADEIDTVLQQINKAKDARHEAIMSTLLTMYSSSNSVFAMRRKAGKESPSVIDQPCLTFFGTTIPNHYYAALSDRMLTNGLFARMIVTESGKREKGREPIIRDIPPRIIATAKWWAGFRPGSGNLDAWHPVPVIVEQSDEAKRVLIETREKSEDEYAKAESAGDPVGTTVWGRVSEQTRKLALLYAVSENHIAPRIGLAAVEWASAFVMHQTRRMLFMASEHVAENEFDALVKRAVRYIREWQTRLGPNALMPVNELRRRLKQRPRDFDDIVTELTERGIAAMDQQPGKTKPKTGFKLL